MKHRHMFAWQVYNLHDVDMHATSWFIPNGDTVSNKNPLLHWNQFEIVGQWVVEFFRSHSKCHVNSDLKVVAQLFQKLVGGIGSTNNKFKRVSSPSFFFRSEHIFTGQGGSLLHFHPRAFCAPKNMVYYKRELWFLLSQNITRKPGCPSSHGQPFWHTGLWQWSWENSFPKRRKKIVQWLRIPKATFFL